MKKITYLVAPLMVLPFLVGCKGGKTHTLTLYHEWTSESLSFTDSNKKEIQFDTPVTITEGQDFVFNVTVKAKNEDTKDIVHQDYIIALRGDELEPVTMGFKYTVDDKTSAQFTISGKDITSDFSLIGAEYKEGKYLCAFPYILDTSVYSVSVDKGELDYEQGDWFGYVPTDSTLTIVFYRKTMKESYPSLANILLSKDLEDVVNPSEDGTKDAWATYENDFYASALTIHAGNVKESLFISARGSKSTILEGMSWTEIAEIAKSGEASDYFNYGETKTVEINGHNHLVQIIGFNEDAKNSITFQFKTLISDANGNAITTIWNKLEEPKYSKVNINYPTSSLRNKLEDENAEKSVINMLPPTLKENLREVTKKVGTSTDGTEPFAATDFTTKLFPLAELEAYTGTDVTHATEGEGTEYGYYTDGRKKGYSYADMRALTDVNGYSYPYWTRSPINETSGYKGYRAYAIDEYGYGSNGGTTCYNNHLAMAPAFVI